MNYFSFKGFKKVSSDKEHTVLKHEKGHEIKIAHKAISPKMREQMNKLPKFEDGGIVEGVKQSFKKAFATPTPTPPPAPTQEEKYEAIRTQNKANFGYAEGGQVQPQPSQPAAQDVQASMRKAFKFDEGGGVPPAQFQQDLDAMANQGVRGTGATEEPVNRMDEPVGRQDEESAALDLADHSAKMVDAHSKLVDSHSKIVNALERDAQASASSPQANTAIPGDMGPKAAPEQPGMVPYDTPSQQVPDPGAPQGGLINQAKQNTNVANQAETAAAENIQASQNQNAQIYGKEASGMQDISQKYQQIGNDIHQRYQSLADEVSAGKIDPSHWWDSKSTGSKILTAIGMVLTGAGSQAGQAIDNAIDRDINAQKSNLDNKQTLLGKYMEMYKSLPEAEAAARLTMHAATEGLINQQAAKLGSQNAINAATMTNAQRRQQLLPQLEGLARSQAMMGMYGSMGKNQPTGDAESAYQKQLSDLAILNPERYKIEEAKYLPGVGVAAKPVPEAIHQKLISGTDVSNKLAALESFARQHSGTVLDRKIVNEGRTMAADAQSALRVAQDQGVFKKADQEFIESMISNDPTAFFAKIRTIPKYQEVRKLNDNTMNQYKKAYGVKSFQPSSGSNQPQSGQNQAAMEWLKANPNDPRAAAVKQKLGM